MSPAGHSGRGGTGAGPIVVLVLAALIPALLLLAVARWAGGRADSGADAVPAPAADAAVRGFACCG